MEKYKKKYEEQKILVFDNYFNPLNERNFSGYLTLENHYDLAKNSKFIIFSFHEDIEPKLLLILEEYVKSGFEIYVTTFCLTLKYYFEEKYPQSNVHFLDLFTTLKGHYSDIHLESQIKPQYNREYLLKYFAFSRKPQRDDTILFLKENNLIENNLITFWNERFNEEVYNLYKKENSFNKNDYSLLNDIKIIHNTQKKIITDIEDQFISDTLLFQAHNNSMFNLLTEALHPYYGSNHDILRNYSSVSKKTVLPLIYKNVFHIYPENKPLKNWLIKNGFELFFESDDDFIKNCNIDYYYNKNVQSKLEHNHKKMKYLLSHIIYAYANQFNNKNY